MKRLLPFLFILVLLAPLPAQALITTSIVSYWKLDESSGTAADSAGSNTLTNNNTTAYAAAKINNGADYERGSSQSHSITDQASLSITGDWSMAFWFKQESNTGTDTSAMAIGKDTNLAAGYVVLYGRGEGADTGRFRVFIAGTQTLIHSYADTNMIGTFRHICVTRNETSDLTTLYIDGASADSETVAATPSDGAGDFEIGHAVSGNQYSDGIFDEVGVWSKELTSGECSSLYNSGTGLQYPFGESVGGSIPNQDIILFE